MADNQQGSVSNTPSGTQDSTVGPSNEATGLGQNAGRTGGSVAERAVDNSPRTESSEIAEPGKVTDHAAEEKLADASAAEEAYNKPLVEEVSADVAEEVSEFFEHAAEQNETVLEDGDLPFISFEHVFKTFGDFKVLEDVSFFVNPGETLCILGRSGVGKSVSLQMLMGFLKPDKGSVRVANEDISGFTEQQMQPV
ncbi:MAG: ATP-binding cassette domain-containing protein, partial [Janthinobacterium lividum]